MFKNKNFTLVFLGALVSNVGAMLYSFAVSFYILQISGNNSLIQGVYLAICGITFVVVCLFGGVIADKYNKGKIMYLCDYIKGALILLATLCIYLCNENNTLKIAILFIIGFFGNAISAIFSPASSALIPVIVKEDDLQKANSYFSILNSFQSIAGVLLAGILYSTVSIYALFIIVGVCYIASGISEMFIKYDYKKDSTPLTLKSTMVDIKDGFKYFSLDKPLLILILLMMLLNFFFPPIWDNAMPYIIQTDFNRKYLLDNILTPELYSSVFSIVFAIGSLIAGFIISGKSYKKPVFVNKIAFSVCTIFALAFGISYYIEITLMDNLNAFIISTIILMFLIGVSLVFINVPINVCIQRRVDKNMLGKLNSVMSLGCQGLVPLSSVVAGIVIKYFGVAILLFVCALGFVLISLIYIFNKKVNDLNPKIEEIK